MFTLFMEAVFERTEQERLNSEDFKTAGVNLFYAWTIKQLRT